MFQKNLLGYSGSLIFLYVLSTLNWCVPNGQLLYFNHISYKRSSVISLKPQYCIEIFYSMHSDIVKRYFFVSSWCILKDDPIFVAYNYTLLCNIFIAHFNYKSYHSTNYCCQITILTQ